MQYIAAGVVQVIPVASGITASQKRVYISNSGPSGISSCSQQHCMKAVVNQLCGERLAVLTGLDSLQSFTH